MNRVEFFPNKLLVKLIGKSKLAKNNTMFKLMKFFLQYLENHITYYS